MVESRSVDAAALVDLDRYPISDPTTRAFDELAAECRSQLDATGCCILPGFLRADAVERARADAHALTAVAHHSSVMEASAYLELPDESRPEGHARRLGGPTELRAVPYDRFGADDPLRVLYEWDPLKAFLAAALGKDELFRYDDPLGALNLAVMIDGDELWWHFDQTDFVTSIALETAERGGDFEYAPLIRSVDDERYDDVAAVLRGGSDRVVTVPMTPGTLMLFEGRNSLHRVTPIEGGGVRLVGLLAYDTKPGTCSSEILRLVRYGRAT